jgi:DnaK suppressor protein
LDEHNHQNKTKIVAALEALEAELSDFISAISTATATVELDQGQQGRLSRIDAMAAQKMAEAQKRRAEIRLERVLHIKSQSGHDEFGCCGDCGEPIPMPRLMARPDSVLCIECATARER